MEALIATDSMASSDEDLLLRAKAGPEGVGAVYDLYADSLYGFLLQRAGQKELAEDMVSKVFTKFIEQLPKLEWRGVPLKAWLFRVASHLLIDHWRSAQHRLDVPVDNEIWDPPSPHDNPAWYAEGVLDRDRLVRVIQTLSIRDQEVLDLHFFGQRDSREVAEVLEVTPNHASVLIYRALGRLRTAYFHTYGRPSSS